MEIIEKKLTEIIPYENNPRKNDDAVEKVANSIREFGFKQPIVVDPDGVIIVGHTRYKAAQELGLDSVPCLVADDLSEEQTKAYRLADNKTNEFAGWDFEMLDCELLDISNIDMSKFGFAIRIEDIDTITNGEIEISPELGERNDYVVLQFNNEYDWAEAVELFKLKKVETPDENPKIRRKGIGRVIDGAKALEILNNEY